MSDDIILILLFLIGCVPVVFWLSQIADLLFHSNNSFEPRIDKLTWGFIVIGFGPIGALVYWLRKKRLS